LQFVEAGVFALLPSDPKHVKSGPTHSFLIEERIVIPAEESFVKYIHNASATPAILSGHSEYETALFLCACQHAQYEKTHGMAFVTDFQGFRGVLTDAQIMTNP
jgi:hypothetical protein